MKIPHFRWWIAGLLFVLSVINYIDRQTLSILAPTIQADLQLSDQGYGNIVSLFLVAYTISYLVSGRVIDAVGSRLGLALFAGGWSLAQMATGFAQSVGAFGFCRFALGLGEAGGFTASPKVVGEWFPPKDRGLAVGIYGAGGSVGATLAPLLVIGLATRYGWRSAFVATGLLGLLFAVIWFLIFRTPARHGALEDSERELILRSVPAEPETVALSEKARWSIILQSPAVWALMGARLLTDPVWYFFQFWLPKYLHSNRGFSQEELASMWLIFLAADVGFVVSGILAGALIKRGWAARPARLRVMLGCAVIVPIAPLAAFATTRTALFAVAMIVVLAHTGWLASISTYVVDLVPKPILGTAFGFIAAGSAIGGILMNQAVVWAIANWSYDACFYAMIVLHPVAYVLLRRLAVRDWTLSERT
jgi:ACS family hexuronate transporter-like MFS transporter